jgi:hypothetical protein
MKGAKVIRRWNFFKIETQHCWVFKLIYFLKYF